MVHRSGPEADPRRARHGHEKPQRAAALTALPGRTRLRADVPVVALPTARHGQPDHDRRPRHSRASPRSIRAQDDHLKVAEKPTKYLLCDTPFCVVVR